jgi:hypothetical protein
MSLRQVQRRSLCQSSQDLKKEWRGCESGRAFLCALIGLIIARTDRYSMLLAGNV